MPTAIKPNILSESGALPEHTRILLRRDIPEADLAAGAKGTIVHVYNNGGYEVEFIEGRARPVVVTLEVSEVERLTGE